MTETTKDLPEDEPDSIPFEEGIDDVGDAGDELPDPHDSGSLRTYDDD
jgi:hypothetical protein